MVGSANIDELLWVSIAYVLARVRDRRQVYHTLTAIKLCNLSGLCFREVQPRMEAERQGEEGQSSEDPQKQCASDGYAKRKLPGNRKE